MPLAGIWGAGFDGGVLVGHTGDVTVNNGGLQYWDGCKYDARDMGMSIDVMS